MQKQEMQSGSAEEGHVESKAAQGICKILQFSRYGCKTACVATLQRHCLMWGRPVLSSIGTNFESEDARAADSKFKVVGVGCMPMWETSGEATLLGTRER